jgi:glutathione-specific gamma-glutamylcyclotransferase
MTPPADHGPIEAPAMLATDASTAPHPLAPALTAVRDPAPLLAEAVAEWRRLASRHAIDRDLWVFGYASLIWRPEFESAEHRSAKVHGWHRALQMRSRVNRGTPERPGLVFALLSGGSCQGMVYRIPQARVADELARLWQREMPTGVYDPKWLRCQTPKGPVTALAFTLSRRSAAWVGRLEDPHLVQLLRHARGRYGTTLDYLLETARCLREHGIRDREVDRLVGVARRHGLTGA